MTRAMGRRWIAGVAGVAGGLALCQVSAAAAQEVTVDESARRSLALTIYNNDLALVLDRRRLDLPAGDTRLAIDAVSHALQPQTVSIGAPDLVVNSQAFDANLLTPRRLLSLSVGKEIGVIRHHPTTGEEIVTRATVLSTADGVVLRIGDRIETGSPGRMVFDDVPPGLRPRPTLFVDISRKTAGPTDLDIRYLTGGIGWRADYVAELSADETHLDLSGWITVANNSGIAYRKATLRFVAGDLNRATGADFDAQRARSMEMAAAEPPAMPQQAAAFEYHVYSFAQRADLGINESRQLALLHAAEIPVAKRYRINGQQHVYGNRRPEIQEPPVAVWLSFENAEANNVGQPLPAGVVRVYQPSGEVPLFLGEDRIGHTPLDAEVELNVGTAFDVTAERKQTDFRTRELPRNMRESAYSVVVRNAKDQPVEVVVSEPIPGDWRVMEESHPHEKVTSGRAEWTITVPAEGETELTYRVRVQY